MEEYLTPGTCENDGVQVLMVYDLQKVSLTQSYVNRICYLKMCETYQLLNMKLDLNNISSGICWKK